MSYKNKIFLKYNNVKIFHTYKGSERSFYWYSFEPDCHPEFGDKLNFDVRKLPEKYTDGLVLEDISEQNSYEAVCAAIDRVSEDQKEALRRAIDDKFDLIEFSKTPQLKTGIWTEHFFMVNPAASILAWTILMIVTVALSVIIGVTIRDAILGWIDSHSHV